MRTTHTPLPAVLAVLMLTACSGHRMHLADRHYDLMAYDLAQRLYERIPEEKLGRDAMLRSADACRRQNKLAESARRYQRAEAIAPLAGTDAFRYGQVLMGLDRPSDAGAVFQRVLTTEPGNRAAQELHRSCMAYRELLADSNAFIINRLNIPGLQSVFSAVPFRNGLLLTGETEQGAGPADPWNGRSFVDLFHSEKKTIVNWQAAVPVPGDVNGPYHDGTAVLSPDGRHMYFTRSDHHRRKLNKDADNTSHLKLFRATYDSTRSAWTDIRSFAYNGTGYTCAHPALSSDGNTLYFTSDMAGGQGGMDIWRCRRNGESWNAPENLGTTVNTPGNEVFPVVNGDALHFSSDAHFNLGGLDIFETHETEGRWSEPRNLNYPVNTVHDDFSLVLDGAARLDPQSAISGYLSSDRDGADRVYVFSSPAPAFVLEGLAMDELGRFLENVEISLVGSGSATDTTVLTGQDGRFRLTLRPDADLSLRVSRKGYMNLTRSLSTRGLLRSEDLTMDLRMTPIALDVPIAIDNILFDYDQWDIRPDAARELDKLAALMVANPDLSYELDAHTDSRGSDNYNLVLSDARANSTVNYLIQKGVNPGRISAHGHGETTLLNRCRDGVTCGEEEHQANRRVEFRVTGIRYAEDSE